MGKNNIDKAGLFNVTAQFTTAGTIQWAIDDVAQGDAVSTTESMSEDGSTTYTATLAGVSLAAEQTITATLAPNDGTEPVVATGTVAKENTEKTKIAAFVQLVDTVASQKVPVGTALENVILPTVLKATDNEDNTVTLNVIWICEPGYNGSVIGDYVFTAVISNEVILNENIELPKITVSVQEMVEETVTLTENITVTEPIIVESGVTLTYDLNGYRLYSELQNDKESLFVVKNGGNLV